MVERKEHDTGRYHKMFKRSPCLIAYNHGREKEGEFGMKKFIFVALLIFLAACSGKTEDIRFDHIHGVGFHPDGNKIYAAVHQQLLVYEEGKWNAVDGNAHDYMGFNIAGDRCCKNRHPQY